jgi:hypothetical protein
MLKLIIMRFRSIHAYMMSQNKHKKDDIKGAIFGVGKFIQKPGFIISNHLPLF